MISTTIDSNADDFMVLNSCDNTSVSDEDISISDSTQGIKNEFVDMRLPPSDSLVSQQRNRTKSAPTLSSLRNSDRCLSPNQNKRKRRRAESEGTRREQPPKYHLANSDPSNCSFVPYPTQFNSDDPHLNFINTTGVPIQANYPYNTPNQYPTSQTPSPHQQGVLDIVRVSINKDNPIRDGHGYPVEIILADSRGILRYVQNIKHVYNEPSKEELHQNNNRTLYLLLDIKGLKSPAQSVFNVLEINVDQPNKIKLKVKFTCRPRAFLKNFPNGSFVKMDISLFYLDLTGTFVERSTFREAKFRFNPNNCRHRNGKFKVLSPNKHCSHEDKQCHVLGENFTKDIQVFFDQYKAEVLPPEPGRSYTCWRTVNIPPLGLVCKSACSSNCTEYTVTVTVQQKTRGRWTRVEGAHQFTYKKQTISKCSACYQQQQIRSPLNLKIEPLPHSQNGNPNGGGNIKPPVVSQLMLAPQQPNPQQHPQLQQLANASHNQILDDSGFYPEPVCSFVDGVNDSHQMNSLFVHQNSGVPYHFAY